MRKLHTPNPFIFTRMWSMAKLFFLFFLVGATFLGSLDSMAGPENGGTAENPDSLVVLTDDSISGTNRLGNIGLRGVMQCLQQLPKDRQWLRDIFFYSNGVACFDIIGPEKTGFFNLSVLESTMGISLDMRPENAIVQLDEFGGDAYQLFLNPLATHFVRDNFVGLGDTSPELLASAQAVYDNNRDIARSFVYAYVYLTRYADFDAEVEAYRIAVQRGRNMLQYLRQFTPAAGQGYENATHDFDGKGEVGFPDGFNRFRFAVGFWLRRGIDGSVYSFKSLMDSLMFEYDEAWYREVLKVHE